MAYSACKIMNISDSPLVILGQELQRKELLRISDEQRIDCANSDALIKHIVNATVQICDADGPLEGLASQIAHLQKY